LSAVFESSLNALERRYQEQKTYLRFLRQTYKELVIFGFLSFFLIILRDFYPTLTKNQFQIIETAHLLLFSVGLAFLLDAIQISETVKPPAAKKRKMKEKEASPYDLDPEMMPIMERYHDKAAMVRTYGGRFLKHRKASIGSVVQMLKEGVTMQLDLTRILKPIFDFMDKNEDNLDEVMLEEKAAT